MKPETKLGMTLSPMDNGTYRVSFVVSGMEPRVVVGTSRGQALDLAFKEIRKLLTETTK